MPGPYEMKNLAGKTMKKQFKMAKSAKTPGVNEKIPIQARTLHRQAGGTGTGWLLKTPWAFATHRKGCIFLVKLLTALTKL